MSMMRGVSAQDYSTAGSVSLDHFTCPGKFNCLGTAVLHSSQLNEAHIAGSAELRGTTANRIHTSGSLNASNCRLGTVDASGRCQISRCTVLNELNARGSVNLTASKVHGNVFCSGKPEIVDSAIDKTLEVASRSVTVRHSSIGEIIAKPFSYSYSSSFFGFSKTQYKGPQKVEVELDGTDCKVGTIRFDTPDPGVVILKNGAPPPKVINGQILLG